MTSSEIFIGFDLLDRQILDRDGQDVGKVDDVELRIEDGALYLAALLVGPQALGPRLGGQLGRWVAGVAARLSSGRSGPVRIPYDVVSTVDNAVHLTVRRELLPEPELESWLRQHLIGRIPGGDHDG
jgi:sporulation protein YlmC with PRC-barrel domain